MPFNTEAWLTLRRRAHAALDRVMLTRAERDLLEELDRANKYAERVLKRMRPPAREAPRREVRDR